MSVLGPFQVCSAAWDHSTGLRCVTNLTATFSSPNQQSAIDSALNNEGLAPSFVAGTDVV